MAGAEVFLCDEPNRLFDINERLEDFGPTHFDRERKRAVTAADGSFELTAEAQNFTLVIHDPTGLALLDQADFKNGAAIVLPPYGRVEGLALDGRQPRANATIRISRVPDPIGLTDGPEIMFNYTARTDAQGRFVFEKVPAARARISSDPAPYTPGARYPVFPLEVKPGAATRIQLGGTGRALTGRIALTPGSAPGYPLARCEGSLEPAAAPARPRLPREIQAQGADAVRRWLKEWEKSTEGREFVSHNAYRLDFAVAPDGRFRVSDLPAGKYIVLVMAYPPDGSATVLGKASRTLEIPPIPGGRSDEPLDMGTLEIPVAAFTPSPAPAPALAPVPGVIPPDQDPNDPKATPQERLERQKALIMRRIQGRKAMQEATAPAPKTLAEDKPTSAPGREIVFKIRLGESKQWRNLALRLLRVGTAGGLQFAEFTIDHGTETENRNMEVNATEFIDNYKIVLEEVNPTPGGTGFGSARFRITYLPPAAQSPYGKPAEKLLLRIYKIKEQDGPRLKAQINAILTATSAKPFYLERQVIIDKESLIVRDTAENMEKVEELLRDKKFVQEEINTKLDIANFRLLPRGAKSGDDQARAFASRTVASLKDLLYATAKAGDPIVAGRHLWFDPATQQLTLIDTTTTLARVNDYLESLPELRRTRQEVILLKNQPAEDVVEVLKKAVASDKVAEGSEFSIASFPMTSDHPQGGVVIRYSDRILYKNTVDLIAQLDKPGIRLGVAANEKFVRTYKINEPDGSRLKALVEAVAKDTLTDAPDNPRRVLLSPTELILRDSAANLAKLEAKGVNAKLFENLHNHTYALGDFSLVPLDTETITDRERTEITRAVAAYKQYLMQPTPGTTAAAEGRMIRFDPQTLHLAVVDSPDLLVTLGQLLDNALGFDRTANPGMINLRNTRVEALGKGLKDLLKTNAKETPTKEAVFRLHNGEKLYYGGLIVNVPRVTPAGVSKGSLSTVALELGDGKETASFELAKGASKNFADYRVTAEAVAASPGSLAGSVRLRLSLLNPPRVVFEQSEITPWFTVRTGLPGLTTLAYRCNNLAMADEIKLVAAHADGPAPAATMPGAAPEKQEVLFLKFAVADGAVPEVMNRIAPPGRACAITAKMTSSRATTVGDLHLHLVRIDLGTSGGAPSGSVQLSYWVGKNFWRDGKNPTYFKLAPGETKTLGGHPVTLAEIGSDANHPNQLWASLKIGFTTAAPKDPGESRPRPGVSVDSFGALNALIVRYRTEDELDAVREVVKMVDHPTSQISIETRFLELTTTTAARVPLDPKTDLGATEMEVKIAPLDQKGHLAAPLAPTRAWTLDAPGSDPLRTRLKTLQREGRLQLVIGPKVTALDGMEAQFRIELNAPLPSLDDPAPQGPASPAVVLRVTPELNEKTKTIQLHELAVELTDASKVGRRQFELELKNGQSILLTVPEFKNYAILLTAAQVE